MLRCKNPIGSRLAILEHGVSCDEPLLNFTVCKIFLAQLIESFGTFFRIVVGGNIILHEIIIHTFEGIVAIGGDGTFKGARALTLKGIPCIGIPGTIDNDIASCDHTIGYDTALNTVMAMVDRIRDTTESHDRCSVVEVMGRNAGYLALNAGLAIGATCILIPEVDYDIDSYIIERMKRTQKTGKEHFVIVIAEGVKGIDAHSLAKYIEQKTGVESRATILGHVQRGGSPSVRDRVLASQMGNYAVQLLKNDIGNRVVASCKEKIVDYDIIEALNMKKTIDLDLYRIANEISI